MFYLFFIIYVFFISALPAETSRTTKTRSHYADERMKPVSCVTVMLRSRVMKGWRKQTSCVKLLLHVTTIIQASRSFSLPLSSRQQTHKAQTPWSDLQLWSSSEALRLAGQQSNSLLHKHHRVLSRLISAGLEFIMCHFIRSVVYFNWNTANWFYSLV